MEIDEITLEDNPEKDTGKHKEEELDQIPKYTSRIELEDADKERIKKAFWKEFDAIKAERVANHNEERWEAEEIAYSCCAPEHEEEEQQFDMHMGLTKSACNTVVNRMMEAFMESDKRFAYTPRPEYDKEGGRDVTERQEQFVDYALDEVIPYREAKEQQVRCAVKHGNGILKWIHKIIREPRKREESYKGTPEWWLTTPKGKVKISQQEKDKLVRQAKEAGQEQQIPLEYKNDGLAEFIKAYPDPSKVKGPYESYVKRLTEGKSVDIIADYTETIYNDPYPKYVELKNFYVRASTEGVFGLATTLLIVERVNYEWWELEALKDQPEYFDDAIEDMKYKSHKDKEAGKAIENHEAETYDVLCAEFNIKVKESDEKSAKILVYFSEDMQDMIGAQYYPYYSMPTQYNEMHITKEYTGFYQPGIIDSTIDDNNIMDVIVNLLIEGIYAQTVITPIVEEGSKSERDFLNRRAMHGLPMCTSDGKPMQFFNQYMKPVDVGGILRFLQYTKQSNDSKWGGSNYLTGQEAPLDPTAPATKTLALLSETNKNIKVYILSAMPSFNFDARAILSLYYQIAKEGRKYRLKKHEDVAGKTEQGKDLFGTLSRSDMAARTNIQSQAFNFALDKVNERKETMLVLQLLRNELLVTQDPEAVYSLIKDTIKSISPQWRNRIDKVLPSPEDLQKKIVQRASQGVALYVNQLTEQSKQTGQKPPVDPRELLAAVQTWVKELATPPTEEQVKEREKNATKV